MFEFADQKSNDFVQPVINPTLPRRWQANSIELIKSILKTFMETANQTISSRHPGGMPRSYSSSIFPSRLECGFESISRCGSDRAVLENITHYSWTNRRAKPKSVNEFSNLEEQITYNFRGAVSFQYNAVFDHQKRHLGGFDRLLNRSERVYIEKGAAPPRWYEIWKFICWIFLVYLFMNRFIKTFIVCRTFRMNCPKTVAPSFFHWRFGRFGI